MVVGSFDVGPKRPTFVDLIIVITNEIRLHNGEYFQGRNHCCKDTGGGGDDEVVL